MRFRIGLGIWSIQVLLDSYHTEYCHILLTEYQHYQKITVSKILGKTLLTGSHWGIPWNHLLLWDYCLWSLSGWLLQNPLLLGLLFGFFTPVVLVLMHHTLEFSIHVIIEEVVRNSFQNIGFCLLPFWRSFEHTFSIFLTYFCLPDWQKYLSAEWQL